MKKEMIALITEATADKIEALEQLGKNALELSDAKASLETTSLESVLSDPEYLSLTNDKARNAFIKKAQAPQFAKVKELENLRTVMTTKLNIADAKIDKARYVIRALSSEQ